MASTPVGAEALKAASELTKRALVTKDGKQDGSSKPKKSKVLDEEDFVEKVEKIIERDFFPDLEKIRIHSAYLDAVSANDSIRAQELEKQLQTPLKDVLDTPSKDDWEDDDLWKDTPGPSTKVKKPLTREEQIKKEINGLSLTQFMATHTSEDNDSFKELMKNAEILRRKKLDWLYKDDLIETTDKLLMPPPDSLPKPAIKDKQRPNTLDGWKYKVHNALMYNPEGSELTEEEKFKLKESQTEIKHSATRLTKKPWSAPLKPNVTAVVDTGSNDKTDGFWKGVVEKVGIDGKEKWEIDSPKVNGYGFVATPSPRPGAFGESPLMTWGEVDSTPYLIDNSDASKFKMKEPSEREQLAIALSEKNSAAKKKKKAIESVQANFSGNNLPSSPAFHTLSPAARRLAMNKLGINKGIDKNLRASYTPGRKTPSATPSISPYPTPSFSPQVKKTPTQQRDYGIKMKNKNKASDFF